MLHFFVSKQEYLVFQAWSIETGTGGKHEALKGLEGRGPIVREGETFFHGVGGETLGQNVSLHK